MLLIIPYSTPIRITSHLLSPPCFSPESLHQRIGAKNRGIFHQTESMTLNPYGWKPGTIWWSIMKLYYYYDDDDGTCLTLEANHLPTSKTIARPSCHRDIP
jgi:hypothetical protein